MSRNLFSDPLLTSIDSLRKYETFGSIFSAAHGLIALIPSIQQRCFERARTIREGGDLQPTVTWFEQLEQKILAFDAESNTLCLGRKPDAETLAVVETYRHALLIYLYSSDVCDDVQQAPHVTEKLQRHAMLCLQALATLQGTSSTAILLWSFLIASSCLEGEQERNMVRELISNTGPHVAIVSRAMDVLEKTWQQGSNLGPYGMHIAMTQHNIRLIIT